MAAIAAAVVLLAMASAFWYTNRVRETAVVQMRVEEFYGELSEGDIERMPTVIGKIQRAGSEVRKKLMSRLKRELRRSAAPRSVEDIGLRLALLSRDGTQIYEIIPWMLNAPLAELRSTLPLLEAHANLLSQEAWEIVESEESTPKQRLNASAIAAGFDSRNEVKWQAHSEEIVELFTQFERHNVWSFAVFLLRNPTAGMAHSRFFSQWLL